MNPRSRPRRIDGAAIRRQPRQWCRGATVLFLCAGLAGAAWAGAAYVAISALHHVYRDREHLPDLEPFARFEFPAIGRIHDTNGLPLIELAREYRHITQYGDIPPIVRDAILAAEDKRFFSHDGVDYASLPRVLLKVRRGPWLARLASGGRNDRLTGRGMFSQGGSTLTQQLVRGVFLRRQTSEEHSGELRHSGFPPRALASVLGASNANMVLRKAIEIRLALWVEEDMRRRLGSKLRAKQALFARYASFVYMGNGQYGFESAAHYYFGQPLSALTADDADRAALLAGIMKAPRDYAPTADPGPVLRRRNQILALMAARDFITEDQMTTARNRPLPAVVARTPPPFHSSAVVDHVLAELGATYTGLGVDDLLQGRIQVHTTVDARVQRIASDALEHGLERYEKRYPGAAGVVQGSVVVLGNRDGRILAETGGRQVFNGRSASYSDYNRVTRSLRQPGSAMKPFVYLAAFRHGRFTLDTLVPDEPISVADDAAGSRKWIANYDGLYKGLIPIRQALAESRNAVAVWMTGQIGIDRILQTSRSLGVSTPLEPYASTALGASEVTLLELANGYRTMASGIVAEPYVIQSVVRDSGEDVTEARPDPMPLEVDATALSLIREGLRGVVRLPSGTAHALASRTFPIAVMGKTGTTSAFRDAIFVGSTYGPEGITVAVRIGFDDNRSLGPRETGGRLAMPVFRELMLAVYRDELAGPAPLFPTPMERRITAALRPPDPVPATAIALAAGDTAHTFASQTVPRARPHP